jgi:hypothetical protein
VKKRLIIFGSAREGENQMVIYKVYLRSSGEKGELIGVLPERRVNRARIDSDSVMKWSMARFGNTFNPDQLCFVQKTI